jgi:hypothetical protein
MSAELERRLRRAFAELPKPARNATVRARTAALAAVAAPTGRRSKGGLLLLASVVGFAAAAGAAALAATGNLHVDIGARTRAPVVSRLTFPAKTHGIAVVAGGRLWLATRGGLRIEGMPATTAELSPQALYAVVGVGDSLVVFAPGKRRAWTHGTSGPVVAASWSPDGLKIAYVTRGMSGNELRLIEGDGDNDRLLDPDVAALKPRWRANSLAISYRTDTARNATFDLFRNRRALGSPATRAAASPQARARSPRGDETAVAVSRPHHILEVRVLPPHGRPGQGQLLLRVRAARSPVVISWR